MTKSAKAQGNKSVITEGRKLLGELPEGSWEIARTSDRAGYSNLNFISANRDEKWYAFAEFVTTFEDFNSRMGARMTAIGRANIEFAIFARNNMAEILRLAEIGEKVEKALKE